MSQARRELFKEISNLNSLKEKEIQKPENSTLK